MTLTKRWSFEFGRKRKIKQVMLSHKRVKKVFLCNFSFKMMSTSEKVEQYFVFICVSNIDHISEASIGDIKSITVSKQTWHNMTASYGMSLDSIGLSDNFYTYFTTIHV